MKPVSRSSRQHRVARPSLAPADFVTPRAYPFPHSLSVPGSSLRLRNTSSIDPRTVFEIEQYLNE